MKRESEKAARLLTETPAREDVDLTPCFLEAVDGSASYITKCIDDYVNNRTNESPTDNGNKNNENGNENNENVNEEENEDEDGTDAESELELQEENTEEEQNSVESRDDETNQEL